MKTSSDAMSRRRFVTETVLPEIDLRPFINGEFIQPKSNKTIIIIDPMTQKTLVEMPCVGEEDIREIVTFARKAFDNGSWSQIHPRERAKMLYRLADLIEQNKEELALLESTDAGKRIVGVSAWDIPNAVEVYRYYAGWADKVVGHLLPSLPGVEIFTRREPVGVCAAIIPWNFPFPCIAWKIGPALAVGCTVIVKSAERAPLSAQYLAKLVQQAGFPPGVVNIVAGIGEEAGRYLVSDPRVDKITFTGETATAQDIIKSSVGHLPRVTFELGDKVPNVILSDADLEKAIPAAASAIFGVSGQNCCAGSRTLVDNTILEQVTDGIIKFARKRRLGDPLDDTTEQGPQIDLNHVARIDRYVKNAIADGAVCVTGGSPAGDGQFYQPTLLTKVNNSMQICREEVFGPVGTILPFSGLEEAIHIANDREFGLAAAIWTLNHREAEQFARETRAGTCWINCYEYFDTVAPWGGRKLSGQGRELGVEGIDEFLETKTIVRVF